jgi:hypothetical protein
MLHMRRKDVNDPGPYMQPPKPQKYCPQDWILSFGDGSQQDEPSSVKSDIVADVESANGNAVTTNAITTNPTSRSPTFGFDFYPAFEKAIEGLEGQRFGSARFLKTVVGPFGPLTSGLIEEAEDQEKKFLEEEKKEEEKK